MSQVGGKFNVFLVFPAVIQIIRLIRKQNVSALDQSHVTFCCKISFHKKHAPFYLFVIRLASFDNSSIKRNVSLMWYMCYVNQFHRFLFQLCDPPRRRCFTSISRSLLRQAPAYNPRNFFQAAQACPDRMDICSCSVRSAGSSLSFSSSPALLS